MIFLPLGLSFIILLFVLLALFIFFIFLKILGSAFSAIRIPSPVVFVVILLSLFGSLINIPIKEVRREGEMKLFYGIPTVKRTTIAINFGGAIIPILISSYLCLKFGFMWQILISTIVVMLVCYRFSRPVPGLGIAVPIFIPPLTAAIMAIILSNFGGHAPIIAYVSGVIGVLIGADLLNINKITKLNAPTVSIGGAGTFDGIFLTGILSVILTSIML
jgi:uncharacterized membrane protein